MIPKELFVKTMDSLIVQIQKDKINNDLIKEAFGEFAITHDSSLIIKSVIDLLVIYFDREEIEHYVFFTNFGKVNPESDCLSAADFYDKLINQIQ
jgi:hypothetical protein